MGTLKGQRVHLPYPNLWGNVYIETGVSEGTSMAMACGFDDPPFLNLYGIEIDPEMVEKSSHRFASDNRVKIHHGSSLDVLPRLLNRVDPTVFWLDAHYDGAKQSSWLPAHGQCVLLEELKLIMAVQWWTKPIILIDDSSTFCSDEWWRRGAHGSGMDRSQNPTFQQIYDVLGVIDNRYDIFIHDQCIYCFPR